jgi:putative endopeptidase
MKSILYYITIALITIGLMSSCKSNQTKETKPTEVFSVENMDLNYSPGNDFFEYVNGTWNKTHPIPEDKSYIGVWDELKENNRDDILEIIKEVSDNKDLPEGSIAQKIRDMYNAGMDTVLIWQLDFKPLEDLFTKNENIETVEDVIKFASQLQLYGADPLFFIFPSPDAENSELMIANIYQHGLGLPDRDYYLKTDEANKKIREDYIKHLTRVFKLLNDKAENAALNAQMILDMETRLARASFSKVDNRDPQKTNNKLTIPELENLAPGFNWKLYLTEIGYPDLLEINIWQPPFVEELGNMLGSVSVDDWKVFLKWKLIKSCSPFLGERFSKENFDFFARTFEGKEVMEARWKLVLDVTSNYLGEAIGQLYVAKHFPPEAKEEMLILTENLRKSYRKRIENLSWMEPETKMEALAKLENMNVKIGYPDKWRNYSGLEIKPDEYLGNIIRASRLDFAYEMDKCGKPVDKNDWGMTPQTINAYYHPGRNEIVFPAGILQPPFFNMAADDAMNYGAIGMVIGHEMTHGFDDQGRQYDKDGNLRDWWTEEDAEEFNSRASVLVEQFNKIEVFDSVFINGKLTLGENLADLGGATIAFHAYQLSLADKEIPEKIDGFTGEQRFFLSFAQIWRGTVREELLKTHIKTDPHSPGKYRINGIVYNMPEFYAAFPDVGPDDELYIPVKQRTVVW